MPFANEKDIAINELKAQVAALIANSNSQNEREKNARDIRVANYKIGVIKEWQAKPKIWLGVMVVVFIIAVVFSLYMLNWDINNFFVERVNTKVKTGLSGLTAFFAFLLSAYLLKEIQNRNSDFKNINEFKSQIKVPDDV